MIGDFLRVINSTVVPTNNSPATEVAIARTIPPASDRDILNATAYLSVASGGNSRSPPGK